MPCPSSWLLRVPRVVYDDQVRPTTRPPPPRREEDGAHLRRLTSSRRASPPTCVETGLGSSPSAARSGPPPEYLGIAEPDVDPEPSSLSCVPTWSPAWRALRSWPVLGARLWTEQLTPSGRQAALRRLPGVTPAAETADLAALFEKRCVAGDPSLARVLDAVVWAKP
jgi:hypothetical protein